MKESLSKPTWVLVALLCLLAARPVGAEPFAALITDLSGSVWVHERTGEKAARMLLALPGETHLRVAEGGLVELVFHSNGRAARARGPLELRITATGPVRLAGAGVLQVDTGRQPGPLLDGALRLSQLGGHITRPTGYFDLTTRLESPTSVIFYWNTWVRPPFEVRLFLVDEQGAELQEVWEAQTDETHLSYAGPTLAADTTYGWEILHRERDGEWSERATFRILSKKARDTVRQARQAAAAMAEARPDSPTPHLLLAGVLLEQDLFQEALEEAREAARLRPEAPGVRELLEVLSQEVEAAGVSMGQE